MTHSTHNPLIPPNMQQLCHPPFLRRPLLPLPRKPSSSRVPFRRLLTVIVSQNRVQLLFLRPGLREARPSSTSSSVSKLVLGFPNNVDSDEDTTSSCSLAASDSASSGFGVITWYAVVGFAILASAGKDGESWQGPEKMIGSWVQEQEAIQRITVRREGKELRDISKLDGLQNR